MSDLRQRVSVYKAELIRRPARSAPWKTVEAVGLVTLGSVHWRNTTW